MCVFKGKLGWMLGLTARARVACADFVCVFELGYWKGDLTAATVRGGWSLVMQDSGRPVLKPVRACSRSICALQDSTDAVSMHSQ